MIFGDRILIPIVPIMATVFTYPKHPHVWKRELGLIPREIPKIVWLVRRSFGGIGRSIV